MERLRVPFFVIAIAAMILVVLMEIGSPFLIGGYDVGAQISQQAGDLGVSVPAGGHSAPPGLGIPYLALVDGIALYTVVLMGVGLIIPERLQGRVQGVITLIFSILLILGALVLLFIALAKLIAMVTLLLAFPFGTIAYLIIWGSFPRDQAAVVLSLLMFLKLVFAGCLLAAQQRFIQNKGLVALVLTSLICNIVVAFLHGLVPGILVSILDALAAIVLAIVGIIWAIVLLIGSIPAIVKALRVSAEAAGKKPMAMLNPVPVMMRLVRRGRQAA
jgi:hypothetical protein